MNYPEKGIMVRVQWIDAFGYSNSEKYCVNTTRGEWNGINEAKLSGRDFQFANLLQETSEFDKSKPGHAPEGVKIPLEWIIKIEEYEPKQRGVVIHAPYMKWEWVQDCN